MMALTLTNVADNALGGIVAAIVIAMARLAVTRLWPYLKAVRERAPKPTRRDFFMFQGMNLFFIALSVLALTIGQRPAPAPPMLYWSAWAMVTLFPAFLYVMNLTELAGQLTRRERIRGLMLVLITVALLVAVGVLRRPVNIM